MPAMPAFSPVITAAGLAAAISASGNGLQLAITHVALGTGKYNPTSAATALVNRKEKATVGSGSSASPTKFSVICTFAGYAGVEYDLGEIGFYAGDPDAGGILFAVASRLGERYAVRSPAEDSYTAEYSVTLSGVPASSITVTVDPGAGAAGGVMAAHLAAADPHPQYVLAAGDTMTGPLALPANAASALHAVPKQQLDAAVTMLLGTQSLVANGFLKLPGGLILQWGTSTHVGNVPPSDQTPITVTFPTPFLSAVFFVAPTVHDAQEKATVVTSFSAVTLANFHVNYREFADSVQDITLRWFAIGM